jgi:hypothetical protein
MVAAREEGLFEIVLADANRVNQWSVKSIDTAIQMPASAESTPTERPFLEYGLGRALEGFEYIMLYFTSKATDNVTYNDSKIAIPITVLNVSPQGNTVSSQVLSGADFDTWLAASDTGIACTAGERRLLGKYMVGAKQIVKLGDKTATGLDKANARLLMVAYDDTA